jgi:hypothetical protein
MSPRSLLLLLVPLLGCPTDPLVVPDDDDADDDDSGDADDPLPPCQTWGTPTVLADIDDNDLDEISGLVASRSQPGLLWAIEDSGNPADIIAFDEDGEVLARITLEDRDNRDWEDLALGPCPAGTCLFVADIGDNAEAAAEVALLRLPEPIVDGSFSALTLPADRLPFTYAEGPQDAEALIVEPDGTPVVMTKRGGGSAAIYRLTGLVVDVPWQASNPSELITARPGGPVTLGVTGADLSPDGSRLLVREYFDLQEFVVTDGVAGQARPVPFAAEGQGESVAWDPTGRRYLHVSEEGGGDPPIWQVRCAD